MKNYNNLLTETKQQFIDIIVDELEHNCLLDETIIDRYGDLTEFTTQINSEAIVNMLAYIIGEEIIYSIDEDLKVDEVIEYLKAL